MTSRALICVLMLAASTSVVARESHLAGPGGGGGGNGPQQCQEIDSAVAEATAKAPAKPRVTKTSTPVRATKPAKSVPAVRGDSDAASDAPRVTTPRWHSFLPGMFR
jgi:hypothetical protein